MESNAFATDEFMKWCEAAGTKPYLCLNMGTGTLDEGMLAHRGNGKGLRGKHSRGWSTAMARRILLGEPAAVERPRGAV